MQELEAGGRSGEQGVAVGVGGAQREKWQLLPPGSFGNILSRQCNVLNVVAQHVVFILILIPILRLLPGGIRWHFIGYGWLWYVG